MTVDIELFQFNSTSDKESTIGLNITEDRGQTCVSMFAVDDNEGTPICENFWTVANAILDRELPDKNIEDVQWRHIVGERVNRITYETYNDQPLKITMSDYHAKSQEASAFDDDGTAQHNGFARTVDEYSQIYTPEELVYGKIQTAQVIRYPEEEYSVYQLPCDHPMANDGVISCETPFERTPHMRDDFEYVLVDSERFVKRFEQNDKQTHDHLFSKMSLNSFPTEGLGDNTMYDSVFDTGYWTCQDDHLAISSGGDFVPLTKFVDVPYFPVTVRKGEEAENLRAIAGLDVSSSSDVDHTLSQGADEYDDRPEY